VTTVVKSNFQPPGEGKVLDSADAKEGRRQKRKKGCWVGFSFLCPIPQHEMLQSAFLPSPNTAVNLSLSSLSLSLSLSLSPNSRAKMWEKRILSSFLQWKEVILINLSIYWD
jgi:hypothetical protein